MSGSSSINGMSHNKTAASLDKPTWLLGIILVITGIVLFILNALYATDLYHAAVSSISIGSAVFFLGVISNCCKVGGCLEANALPNPQTKTKTTKTSLQPLSGTISTKDFFESKGLFGVPQNLINEIDIWRKFRTTENLGIALDAGFILDGSPGNGKTTIAQAIAEILGGEYIEKKCGELAAPIYGQTEINITNLFTVPANQFRIVVIDEISGFVPKRGGFQWSDSRITEHFLGIVSGTTQKKPMYILIGTTNNFGAIDEAVVRRGRLGKRFTINNPDETTRRKIFTYELAKIPRSSDENWDSHIEFLVKKLNGHSCAAIVGTIGDAQRKAALVGRPLRTEDF